MEGSSEKSSSVYFTSNAVTFRNFDSKCPNIFGATAYSNFKYYLLNVKKYLDQHILLYYGCNDFYYL